MVQFRFHRRHKFLRLRSDLPNIKPININVSAVTNVNQLLQAIYDQGNALLTGDDLKFNHHIRLAVDFDNKTLTVYDHRRFNVSNPPYQYQERGAKIADGVSFKEEEEIPRDVYIRDLVIHHTDRADMNIHIQIPQMTLDQIFLSLIEHTFFCLKNFRGGRGSIERKIFLG